MNLQDKDKILNRPKFAETFLETIRVNTWKIAKQWDIAIKFNHKADFISTFNKQRVEKRDFKKQ